VPEGSWPHDVSHDPCLKIGEVRSILAEEFPLLTLSKIRHYESIELIHPHRTTSNQRLFSHADAERLRFILREQRDRYLPLEQIRELLRQLDAGEQPAGAHPGRHTGRRSPRPPPRAERWRTRSRTHMGSPYRRVRFIRLTTTMEPPRP